MKSFLDESFDHKARGEVEKATGQRNRSALTTRSRRWDKVGGSCAKTYNSLKFITGSRETKNQKS